MVLRVVGGQLERSPAGVGVVAQWSDTHRSRVVNRRPGGERERRVERKPLAGHSVAGLDEAMSDGGDKAATQFPAGVPVLVDTATGVILRAPGDADLPAMVEQGRDPDTQRWTTVPVPAGG